MATHDDKAAPQTYPLPHSSNDLHGHVALVTGSTAGLGRRFARTLAAAGATVIVTGRRENLLSEVVDQITADGATAHGVKLDMTNEQSIIDAVDAAEAAAGPVTILVNNAGIPDAQRAEKLPTDLIDRVLSTNLRGPFLLSCEVARRLIDAETPGRIVNIASMTGHHYAGGGAALYSVTKSAVVRMTEVLAVEWARQHINVNAISPGAFHSEMMDGMVDRVGDFSHKLPRKRMCDPAQLDSTLLFLCSPASDAVTGTVIKVDDGQLPR